MSVEKCLVEYNCVAQFATLATQKMAELKEVCVYIKHYIKQATHFM
jgi:hypothetical protein